MHEAAGGARASCPLCGLWVRQAGKMPALVRLRGHRDRTVRVRFLAAKSREVSNRNCVAERRGGEQRNENDQSVTQGCRRAVRRELDSVGEDGRACERRAKPVERAIGGKPKRRTAGRSPVVALMVGDGMAGSPCDRNQGDPLGCNGVHGPRGPKSRPAGVRASVVAKKRVMTVEPRDAGKWKDERRNDGRPTSESARKG